MISLSGCKTFNIKEGIIVLPKYENEEYEIFNALKNSTYFKSNIAVETPKRKQKNSSITFLNNDTAVIFYNTKEKNNLTMAILTKKTNGWKCFLKVPFTNSNLEEVFVVKDEENKTDFLIVGTSSGENENKTYEIYSYDEQNFFKITSMKCVFLTVCDIDGDGKEELVFFKAINEDLNNIEDYVNLEEDMKKGIKNTYNEHKKSIHPYDEKKDGILYFFLYAKLSKNEILIKKSECDHTFFYFKNNDIINEYWYDNENFNFPVLFISIKNRFEDRFSANSNSLNILYFHNERLKREYIRTNIENPIDDFYFIKHFLDENYAKLSGCNKTFIAQNMLFPGYQSIKLYYNKKIPYITNWLDIKFDEKIEEIKNHLENKWQSSFKTKELKNFKNTYVDYFHKFGIKLPKRWEQKVSAKYINKNRDIDFFIFENLEEDSKKLLTLKTEFLETKDLNKDFFKLAEKGNIKIMANIYKNQKNLDPALKLTEKELKEMFFTIQ